VPDVPFYSRSFRSLESGLRAAALAFPILSSPRFSSNFPLVSIVSPPPSPPLASALESRSEPLLHGESDRSLSGVPFSLEPQVFGSRFCFPPFRRTFFCFVPKSRDRPCRFSLPDDFRVSFPDVSFRVKHSSPLSSCDW